MSNYHWPQHQYNGDGCATGSASLMQQQTTMLPAYANGMDYSFYQTYPNAFNAPMLPTYCGSPISSLYQNQSLIVDISATNDTSPPTDPSQKHRSPEEQTKYLIKRQKNNEAAKMSRLKRTEREKSLQAKVDSLTMYIQEMQQQSQKHFMEAGLQIASLQAEIQRLKSQQCHCMNKNETEEKENSPLTSLYHMS